MHDTPTGKFASAVTLALLLAALAAPALAEGNISFLAERTTITSGQPFSWMQSGRDWNLTARGATVSLTVPVTNPAGTVSTEYAIPNLPQNLRVVTWREMNTMTGQMELRFIFNVNDNTTTHPTNGALSYGDRIIIQLDPDNDGHTPGRTQLEVGTGVNQDYRFEIAINRQVTTDGETPNTPLDMRFTGFRTPTAGDEWDIQLSALPAGMTKPVVTGANIVEVAIPLSAIGLRDTSTGPIGIAFAYINDIAHAHQRGGSNRGVVADEMTGIPFPSSMGLAAIEDPGLSNSPLLKDPDLTSGSWLNPSQWATGHFSPTGGDVHFEHGGDFYLSRSIRLSECQIRTWREPGGTTGVEGVTDWGTNQSTLPGWYKYYPGAAGDMNLPCRMRVWFRVHRDMTGGATPLKRFLIIWGRPGIAPQDWTVVALTPPTPITNAQETFNDVWVNVPKQQFTVASHPCLRIYALPGDLRTPAGTTFLEADLTRVSTNGAMSQAQLDAIESAFGFQPAPRDPHAAQMNFTALYPGQVCPNTACLQTASRRGGDDSPGSPFRVLKASFIPPASGGGDGDGGDSPLTPTTPPEPGQIASDRSDSIRIFIEGFGIEAPSPNKRYSYIEVLGGLGLMVSNKDLVANRGLQFEVEVANPRLLRRDVTTRPPGETLSPERDVFLRVVLDVPPGVPTPTYTITPNLVRLGPGEKTKAVVTVTPRGGPPPGGFRRWGLSLHAGASVPHDNLGRFFNPGPSFAVDLEYRFNRFFSLEGIYGFHHFRGETLSPGVTVRDVSLHRLSLNGRLYGGSSPLRPFFNAGPGAYKFDPGDVHFGVNVGGGLQLDVNPGFAVEGAYDFHNVFSPGSARFSTAQGGVRFRF
jgi:hypothetical protein